MIRFSALLLLLAVFTASNAYYCPRSKYAYVKTKLRAYVLSSDVAFSYPAKFLFVGFHDCFPGACDGSIKYETGHQGNGKIQPILDLYERARANTCVSLADTIKLSMELAMELTRGPSIKCFTRSTPDASAEGPKGLLPSPFASFYDLNALYRKQGFSTLYMLALNFGGHAIGGFGVNGETLIPRFPFTPDPQYFSRAFLNFARKPDTKPAFGPGSVQGAGPGKYNALPSDINLARAPRSRAILYLFSKSSYIFRSAFAKGMNKMCSM